MSRSAFFVGSYVAPVSTTPVAVKMTVIMPSARPDFARERQAADLRAAPVRA
jgi:hypothetical protein